MATSVNLPESVLATLEKNEQVLWSGKPKYVLPWKIGYPILHPIETCYKIIEIYQKSFKIMAVYYGVLFVTLLLFMIGLIPVSIGSLCINLLTLRGILPMLFDSNLILGFFVALILSAIIITLIGILITTIKNILGHYSIRYFITTKRIGFKHGILSCHIVSTEYNKISDINVSMGWFQKLCGIGDVRYKVTGDMIAYKYENIKDPSDIYKLIKESMEKHKS